MKQATRSRSGQPRDHVGRFTKGGSMLVEAAPVQDRQQVAAVQVVGTAVGVALDPAPDGLNEAVAVQDKPVQVLPQVEATELVAATAVNVDQLQEAEDDEVSRCDLEGSCSDSSSPDSDFDNEEVGLSVEQQAVCSTQLKKIGNLVAQQLLDDMPHSDLTAIRVNRGGGSTAKELEKAARGLKGGARLVSAGPVRLQQKSVKDVQVSAGVPGGKGPVVPGEKVQVSPSAAGSKLGGVSSVGQPNAGVLEKGVGSEIKAPWVNLFKDNRKLGNGIKLHEVVVEGDLVQLDEEDVDEVVGFCLVGLFTGKFPGVRAVQNLRDRWKVECEHWIHRSGWILFEFQSEEDRLKVLNGGPYFAYGNNLMLKILPPCFRFGSEEMTTVPTWIQLPDLPFDCWTERALSKIVSKVGIPITTDELTRSGNRISFARVLVEVDVLKELVTSVEVKLPTGVVYDQLVVFESAPKYCKKCKIFGHGDVGCFKEAGGRFVPLSMPKKKFQHGGVVAGNMEGGRTLSGKPKAGVASSMMEGVLLDELDQPAPCGSGSKVDQAVDGTAELLVPPVARVLQAVEEGSSRPVEDRDTSEVVGPNASPLCPVEVQDAREVGWTTVGNKGKKKKIAGQPGAVAVQQHTEGVRFQNVDPMPDRVPPFVPRWIGKGKGRD